MTLPEQIEQATALSRELERHIEALDRHGLCAGTANFLRNRILSALRTHDDTMEDAVIERCAQVAEDQKDQIMVVAGKVIAQAEMTPEERLPFYYVLYRQHEWDCVGDFDREWADIEAAVMAGG